MLNRVSYMNDTKWEKFFRAVEDSNVDWFDIYGATIKFLVGDDIKPFHFQNYCGGYIEGDYGLAQCKEIEWIFVPSTHKISRWNRGERLQPKCINNEIYALKELVDGLGNYEYDFDEAGLKVYGYK